jgi:hypothetical protein
MTTADFSSKLEGAFKQFDQRVAELKAKAGRKATELGGRFEQFEKARTHVGQDILKPRLDALATRCGTPTVAVKELRGQVVGTLVFPRSDDRQALIQLMFSASVDDEVKTLLLDYELTIIPVFMKFEKNSRLEQPLDKVDDAAVSKWIDERLLSFVETWPKMPFVQQYQGQNLVTDPVLNTRFNKTIAAATRKHGDITLHFATKESAAEFDKDPKKYA